MASPAISKNHKKYDDDRQYQEHVKRIRKNRNSSKGIRANKARAEQIDFTVFFLIIILVLFGTVMIFSSSYYYAMNNSKINDMYYFLKRQMLWVTLGMAGMFFLMNFNYNMIKKFAFFSYLFSIACLILVLFIGEDINGAKRWLFGFQPSEVAKIAVILFLSLYISGHKNVLKDLRGFIKCVIIVAIPTILIGIENLSTAIVVFGVGMCIIFIASPKVWYFVAAIAPAGLLGGLAISLPQFAYRFNRIKIWRDPFSDPIDKGYQIIQSLYAVASGGLFGLGLGQSRQKTFIPEPYNDIIFAIICEELGMVGAIIVILLFAILLWRGVKIAMDSIDMFGCLVATGIISMIGIQAILNISVATNSIPNTGVSLPFISYGGTSLVIAMADMGILLNISRYQKRKD